MYLIYDQGRRGDRLPHLPLPKKPPRCPAIGIFVSAVSTVPILCLFVNLVLMVYNVTLPISPVTVAAIVTVLLSVFRFFDCLVRTKFDRADIAMILFIIATIGVILRNPGGPHNKIALFLMLPILLWTARTMPYPEIYRAVAVTGGALLSVFYLLVAHTTLATAFGVKIYILEALTLGYRNPNETGMYLLLTIFLTLYGASIMRRRIQISFVLLALAASQMHLMYMTASRTGIVVAAACLAVFLLTIIPPLRYILVSRAVCILVLLVPIAFFVMSYFDLFRTFDIRFLNEIVETGRHELYREAIASLSPLDFLIGDTVTYANVNLHNAYLSTLCAYGALILVNLIVILIFTLRRARTARYSHAGSLAYGFALCIIIQSSTESALLFSGGLFATITSIPFVLAFSHCCSEEEPIL